MEDTKYLAEKALEILYIQDKQITNIETTTNEITNNLEYSKYILETFTTFIKPFFRNTLNIFRNTTTLSKNTEQLDTLSSGILITNQIVKKNKSEKEQKNEDMDHIISINKRINNLLENQNRILEETTLNLQTTTTLLKEVNSSSLF